MVALPWRLDHHQREQLFLRSNPEIGAGYAAPKKLARRAGRLSHAGLAPDGESKPERVSRLQQGGRADADIGPEMIGCHPLERFAADDARSAKYTALVEHLREACIIIHR